MRDVFVTSLRFDWDLNGQYAQQLVAELSPEQMIFQPAPNTNHPAWVLSHLHAYHPVIVDLLTGQTPEDPLHHRHGMRSKPETDASHYLPKDALVEAFSEGHAAVAKALDAADEALLTSPMPLPRWRERFPQVGSILPYLMSRHEGLHLGQLSAWRRVQGMPSV